MWEQKMYTTSASPMAEWAAVAEAAATRVEKERVRGTVRVPECERVVSSPHRTFLFPLPMFAHLLFSIILFYIPFFGARAGHGNGIIIIFLCIENETELASKHATCYNSKSCKKTQKEIPKRRNGIIYFFSFCCVWVASVPTWNTRWFLFHFFLY